MSGEPQVLEPATPAAGLGFRSGADRLAMVAGAALAILLLGSADLPLSAGFAVLWWIPVVVVVRSDLDDYIIPDMATAAIGALGLAYVAASAAADASDLRAAGPALAGALTTGAAAFGLFWLIGRLYRVRSGRDGLGFGDVKLAGASALWLSPADGLIGLEIAAVGALVLALAGRRSAPVRDVALPFGAFLAPAAWLVFVTGPGVRALLDP